MKTALTIAIPWMLMWSACASTGDANGSGTPAAAAALAPDASTFYVRPDGGSPSQRSGRVDAAYTEVLKSAPGIIPFARFRRTARRVSPGGHVDHRRGELLTGRNNVFVGDADYFDPGDITFLFYQEGCGDLTFAGDYSIAYGVKNYEPPYVDPPYPSAHNLLQDPQLSGPFSGDSYGLLPTSSSPAIDAGENAACPATDIQGVGRPQDGDGDGSAVCDMAAYERWEPVAWIHLPMVLRTF